MAGSHRKISSFLPDSKRHGSFDSLSEPLIESKTRPPEDWVAVTLARIQKTAPANCNHLIFRQTLSPESITQYQQLQQRIAELIPEE